MSVEGVSEGNGVGDFGRGEKGREEEGEEECSILPNGTGV